jgi:molybdopterin-guanine dinucleotide biosynthesis protein A
MRVHALRFDPPSGRGVYHQRVDDVTAFILAGGKSTRMGRDKAFLELGGRTLLARALELAGTVAREVRIVGGARTFATFGRVVEDVYGERGPLGGIHAALKTTTTELNLMLAVDLPFLEPKVVEYLIFQARQSAAVVTVPRVGGGWQPLCAVYRRSFAGVAEQSLREGRNKIDPLFADVETRVIEEEELSPAGFSGEMFRNLNTQEEWEEAKTALQ